jgi:hypothetical protein
MSLKVPVLRVNTRKVVTSPAASQTGLETEGRNRREHIAAIRRGIDAPL